MRSYDPDRRSKEQKLGAPRAVGDAELEVRLLGPLEVLERGSAVSLGGPKPRALLAALALEVGRVVSVDRLVEDLWPGATPDTASHAIQVYVSQLRKALGSELISRRATGYALELGPDRVDLHRFVRLADEGRATLAAGNPAEAATILGDALALWRGPALADFTYEPFTQAEIARLEEVRVVALEDRIDADLVLGRHAELVPELEALIKAQPLRERPRAQLMLALYRSGRQADALAAYQTARGVLVEELGIEPGPELKHLESAILRQDESLLPKTPATAPAMQFRRLVTILFVDVVESMALADALDAEALSQVLRRYFETVSAALARHGGTVEKFAGDAVMAVFGTPVSHEDDALRAARAALDIRAGVAALNEELAHHHGVGLEIRIGMETGEVVATQTHARQRLVTGEAVGVAARLEQGAGAGEIVVGELAGRLIDHAAQLEPLGEREIKGRREPVRAYRLLEIAQVAPAFERRLDAPLVGRKRELAALRKALRRAVDGSSIRVATVVGPPGVGKSRLAAELARRAKGVTTLFGRCLSYGEGITYWPLREVVQEARGGDARDAVLSGLEAETPPPAHEIAWIFRQFCEALARERPFLVVFDDVHWAEPTFLELLEHLADKGDGPIFVVCLAREELVEDSPAFLEGRANAEQIVLDPLSADETDALLEGLGGAVLESDQRARIVETADGNPFFLEQLLALGLEGGLGERVLPETVQALLAARLDRLGPGERAVLERGAVVGKEFGHDDVVALLEPEAAPTASAHLRTLTDRGFVRPRGDDAFAFRHVLVQEAVYRAAPKRLRAELHERFADRLERTAEGLAELDEFVGFHLERAYHLRGELGESDRRTVRLAEDGGLRLGDAGIRAAKRGDMPATVNLLERATSLLPFDRPLRREFLCELGIGLRAVGDSGAAEDVFAQAIRHSQEAGDRRIEFRARIEHEYVRLPRTHGATGDALLDTIAQAIPMFETMRDDRSLGRAWLLAGFVHGARRGHHKEREESAGRALAHYKSSNWPTSTCLGEIANALYYGPTPVPQAIVRCDRILGSEVSDRAGGAHIEVFLGGLVAQSGDVDEARKLIASAKMTYDDLGQRAAAAIYAAAILGEVELLADDVIAAERILRELCTELERTHAYSHLASTAGCLAEAVYAQGRMDEAEEWTRVAETHSAIDDLDARVLWMPVRAKITASRDAFEEAETLARDAVGLSRSSDAVNRRAKAQQDLGEVLRLAGRAEEAASAFGEAIKLYERKGNVVSANRTRSLREELAMV